MNKKTVSLFAIAALLFLPVAFASAESYSWYRWRTYRLRFKLPTNWNVTSNTSSQFIAKGSNAVIKIQPYRNRRVDARGVAMYGYRTYSVVEDKKIMLRNYGSAASDRNKYNLWGSGTVNGQKVYWRIMALTSSRSANNVFARSWWYANKYNSNRNSESARAVQHSLMFY